MIVLISVVIIYTYTSYVNDIESAEGAAKMFNKIMIKSCSEMIRYDLDDESVLFVERTPEDETNADVYLRSFANSKGKDKPSDMCLYVSRDIQNTFFLFQSWCI